MDGVAQAFKFSAEYSSDNFTVKYVTTVFFCLVIENLKIGCHWHDVQRNATKIEGPPLWTLSC